MLFFALFDHFQRSNLHILCYFLPSYSLISIMSRNLISKLVDSVFTWKTSEILSFLGGIRKLFLIDFFFKKKENLKQC